MKIDRYLQESVFVSVIKTLIGAYHSLDKCIEDAYRHSKFHAAGRAFAYIVSHNPVSNFMSRLTDNEGYYSCVFANSRLINWSAHLFRSASYHISRIIRQSVMVKELKKELENIGSELFKKIGIIVITALVINVIFSAVLIKRIGVIGWAVRIGFLFVGLTAFFNEAEWRSVKSGSKVMKLWEKIRSKLSG